MHKSATKCNETLGKWCKNKHGASKIIDTLETYHQAVLCCRRQMIYSNNLQLLRFSFSFTETMFTMSLQFYFRFLIGWMVVNFWLIGLCFPSFLVAQRSCSSLSYDVYLFCRSLWVCVALPAAGKSGAFFLAYSSSTAPASWSPICYFSMCPLTVAVLPLVCVQDGLRL
jgi:hypothetical protein